MTDEERRLHTAFKGLGLPTAPQSLRTRLALAAANPPASSRIWKPAWLVGAPAVLALVLVALALSTGHLGPQQGRPPATGLAHFDEQGLTFAYPASWQDFHYDVTSSFSRVIAYLATVDVPAPCQTILRSDSTEIDCADRYSLAPDTLVVAITSNGMPGFDISKLPDGVVPLTIGGLPAYLAVTKPSEGILSLVWTLSRPGGPPDNYFQIAATVRGPDSDSLRAQLDALIASLQFDPPVTATVPATPSARPTELPSSDPLPNPGGTCSASQIVPGTPIWGYGYGTIGTTVVFGTVPLQNTGPDCVMRLPSVIGVATATGPFHAVAVRNTLGTATSWGSGSGQSLPIAIQATWPAGGQPLFSARPCSNPIDDVTRIEIPLATGVIELDLPIVLHEVCTSPASMSITFETK